MNNNQSLTHNEICDLLDTLSVQREEVAFALPQAMAARSQRVFADYLDTAALFEQELGSELHKQVVVAATTFIAERLHTDSLIEQLAEMSWVYRELVEVELKKEEQELTLDFEAIPAETVNLIYRLATTDRCEDIV